MVRTAPDDQDDVTEVESITVTGTRIVRPNNRSAAPITTVTTEEITAQGATTIEEVLNRLPQVQVNSEQNYADTDTGGAQRIKLRSLGYERTLTLVDGLRLGIQNGMDVSIIPNDLVERVDVLSGGASSVYGSDAVSGVINFILKKNFEGATLSSSFSFYNHDNRENLVTEAAERSFFSVPNGFINDGGRSNTTLTVGKNFFDDRVNLTGYINYRHSDAIPFADRSTAACEVTQPVRDGALACSLATFTAAGTIIPRSGSRNGQTLVNNPDGSGTFVPINSGPGTAANPFDGFSFQREFERTNAGGFLTAKINDQVEFYANMQLYRDKSSNPQLNRVFSHLSYGGAPYSTPCNNPFLSTAQAQVLCGANAGTAAMAPLDVRYRFDALPPVDVPFENQGARVVAGFRGAVLDGIWNYDVAGVFSRNELERGYQGLLDFDRVNRSLDVVSLNGTPTCRSVINGADPACVPFNAFAPNNSSVALNEYLFSTGNGLNATSVNGTTRNIPRMVQVLATVSGDLGRYGITSPYAETGVAIALGLEYRDEKFKSTADQQFRDTNGGTDAVFSQNVTEANVEVQIPLVEDRPWTQLLQFNGGYRVSKYDRLEGTFDTWKIEGLWAPVADITFRASYNKAQRAPTVIEADQASNVNFAPGFRDDPCAPQQNPANPNQLLPPSATLAQCRNTGLPDNLYGSATLSCPNQQCTVRNGGFGLTPETGYTTTFGVVVRPRFLPGLTFSADRFLIDLDDSINFFSAGQFVDNCLITGLDFYCRGVVRNPGNFNLFSPPGDNPEAGFVAQGTSNGYKSESHGWDFQGSYDRRLGSYGSLNLAFNGTYTTRVGGQDSPDVEPRNCAGYFGQPFCGESLPKWSHSLRSTWGSPDSRTSVSLNWRYTGSQTISSNAESGVGIPATAADRRTTFTEVKGYDYFDVSTSYNLTENIVLRLSANNIFDRDPPLLPNARNVLGLLRNNTLFRYDMLGRQIVMGASLRF